MQNIQGDAASIKPIKSDNSQPTGDGVKGWTVDAGTWLWSLGNKDAEFIGVHIALALAVNLTSLVVDVCNLPEADIKSLVVGDWIPWNPTTVFVAKDGADMAVAALTISKPAATALGGAYFDLQSNSRRLRLRGVVAVGGLVRVATHGKD